MFWGLIMEPKRRYSQKVRKAFHVSMAALDISSSTDDPVQVMVTFEERNYLICTLKKDDLIQVALDLNFEEGDEVSFAANGNSHIHLTGYLNDDMMQDLEDEDCDEEMEEEESEDDELDVTEKNIVTGKRLANSSNGLPRSSTGLSEKMQKKLQKMGMPATKKTKTMKLLEEVDSQEDDDSADSDINSDDLEGGDDTADVEEDDDAEEEEDDNEDEEDNEEEDDDDDASELSAEEEEDEDVAPKKKKAKQSQNGTLTKADVTSSSPLKKVKKEVLNGSSAAKVKEEKTPKKGGKLEGGVTYEDVKVGSGTVAKAGKFVQVYYEGRLKSNNKMFDSTVKGPPFKFRLGRGEVIKGWDVGVAGMKVGGKRRITCPPNMAYGKGGAQPEIPPNATLVFEVELKNAN